MRLVHTYRGREEIIELSKGEIVVGRPGGEAAPDLPLPEHDYSASRRHARIFLKDNAVWIEDLKSRHGTYLNGEKIQGKGAVPLPAGAPIRIGESILILLAVVGDRASALRHLRAEVRCLSKINYALVHLDKPFLLELSLLNDGDVSIESVELRIHLPGYARSLPVSVRSVPAKGRLVVNPLPKFEFDRTRFTEPEEATASLEVYADGQRLDLVEPSATRILPRDAWYGLGEEAVLACFALSQSVAVNEIVRRAATHLRFYQKEAQTFEEVIAMHPEPEIVIAKSFYSCLQEGYEIAYGREPRTYASEWQRIRFPKDVIRDLEGTCIDLALLMAACLENRHLFPVILILQTGVDASGCKIYHALVGCWLKERQMNDMVEWKGSTVQGWVEEGNLLLLDSVGFARGGGGDKPFQACRKAGKEYLDKACSKRDGHRFEFVLDLCQARMSGYGPLPFGDGIGYDRKAWQALSLARREAEEVKTCLLGARHLLLGLLGIEQGLMKQVFARCGEGVVEEVLKITRSSFVPENQPNPRLGKTAHWEAIIGSAEQAAASSGTLVTEADLARALLKTPSQIDRVLTNVNQTREECLEILNRLLRGDPPPSLWRSSGFV